MRFVKKTWNVTESVGNTWNENEIEKDEGVMESLGCRNEGMIMAVVMGILCVILAVWMVVKRLKICPPCFEYFTTLCTKCGGQILGNNRNEFDWEMEVLHGLDGEDCAED